VIICIVRQMIHDVYINVRGNRMDNQEWIESKDTGNIVHTRNRAKTNKTKTKHDTTHKEQHGPHQTPGVNPDACDR
jgi:hypothetical protein